MKINLFSKYIHKNYENNAIFLRKNSVDLEVYDYVFKEKYHRPYKELIVKDPVILDLGSNIGLTVIDYKSIYPNSKIYAYEMDIDNYKLSLKNCKNLSGCNINNLAIWSKATLIKYDKGVNVDAYKIKINLNTKDDLAEVDSISINQIIEKEQIEVVDFLKMDIEGAEHEIFRHELDWLDITRQIKIEIHDGEVILNFIWKKLEEKGFLVVKDTNHWSTIIGYRE